MNILDKIDPIKRRYIDTFLQSNEIVKINDDEYTFANNRSIIFYKSDTGYIFNSDNYFRSSESDPEIFVSIIKRDIEYQIENLENIQKILWGIIFHENIPEFCANLLLLSKTGIRDIYDVSYDFIDFPEIESTEGTLAPSELYKKALQFSQKFDFNFLKNGIFLLDFENYRESGKFLDETFFIKPDPAFYPKSHHEKIEYVEFLKNWVESN